MFEACLLQALLLAAHRSMLSTLGFWLERLRLIWEDAMCSFGALMWSTDKQTGVHRYMPVGCVCELVEWCRQQRVIEGVRQLQLGGRVWVADMRLSV
jgi:hypothetical protein